MDHDALISRLIRESPLLKIFTPPSNDVFSVHAIQGRRAHMEDTYIVQNFKNIDFYGVFDGHGGGEISAKLKDKMWDYLMVQIRSLKDIHNSDQVKSAIRDAFLNLDQDFFTSWTRSAHDPGSTAVIGVKIKNKLYLGNLGDSRGIIFASDGKLLATTKDHKPVDERERIEKAGGHVYYGRVNGNLAVSRAFGDFIYKLNNDQYRGLKSEVSPLPDVFGIDLSITGPVIMVLASDGLWDCLSSENIVNEYHKEDFGSLASRLVNLSYNNGSTDNITALAVKFFP